MQNMQCIDFCIFCIKNAYFCIFSLHIFFIFYKYSLYICISWFCAYSHCLQAHADSPRYGDPGVQPCPARLPQPSPLLCAATQHAQQQQPPLQQQHFPCSCHRTKLQYLQNVHTYVIHAKYALNAYICIKCTIYIICMKDVQYMNYMQNTQYM